MKSSSVRLRACAAEALGTGLLVLIAVGVATLTFGFKLFGASTSAGVVATAVAFGFTLLALAYALGPISGAHVNPAVTLGFLVSGRMSPMEAVEYWIAQCLGAIAGAAVLYGIVSAIPGYTVAHQGLGADGWGRGVSLVGIGASGAFITEVVLTFAFVLVVLLATSRMADSGGAGIAIGAALLVVHLIGIPLTGTSVNPARSLGPALIIGGRALDQLWLFIVAPLIGGIVAGLAARLLVPADADAQEAAPQGSTAGPQADRPPSAG